MASQLDMQQWIQDTNVPMCVISKFVDEHNGVLPTSNAEFCSWATAGGWRLSDGTYKCPKSVDPNCPSCNKTGSGQNLWAWTGANPGPAALAAFGLAWLLSRRK